jgi:hypothetical protein
MSNSKKRPLTRLIIRFPAPLYKALKAEAEANSIPTARPRESEWRQRSARPATGRELGLRHGEHGPPPPLGVMPPDLPDLVLQVGDQGEGSAHQGIPVLRVLPGGANQVQQHAGQQVERHPRLGRRAEAGRGDLVVGWSVHYHLLPTRNDGQIISPARR